MLISISESSAANNIGGCFSSDSSVLTETRGHVQMKDLQIGDRVLSKTVDGDPIFSEVYMFLDKKVNKPAIFIQIETEDHQLLKITDKHLIYASNTNDTKNYVPVFAESIQVGHYVFVNDGEKEFLSSRVLSLKKVTSYGVYAPLTTEGSVVVDGVVTSCYGVINNEFIAHAAFSPVRALHWLLQYISLPLAIDSNSDGVHWYADILYNLGTFIFDESVLYKV